jgi:[acyl-carrier-protein] S-malonyltransferase
MSTALVFPGQGSQTVGMGRALAEAFPAAKQVFDEVDAALGQKLSELVWNGPEAELTLTSNAQPALMAVSLAALRVLEAEKGLALGRDIACVAGHSLGEYSALAAVGSIGIADTARLLRIRGDAMQQAVPVGKGAMAALLGADALQAATIALEASQGEICQVANDNGGGQVVISGAHGAVTRALDIAKAHGVRRAILLPVSAPFHCALMQPAAEAMAVALAGVTIAKPVTPVYANVTAAPELDPEAIRRNLVAQVTGTVRWRETMLAMAEGGVTHLVEIGAGKVLSGLVKRVAETITAATVGTPEDVASFALA